MIEGLTERRKQSEKTISKIRQIVLDRDGNKCLICGTATKLQVDHIISLANGGSDEMVNLQTLCKPCNQKKSGGVKRHKIDRTGQYLKLIHLSAEVIKALTIQAVNADTNFKEYVQEFLTKKSGVK